MEEKRRISRNLTEEAAQNRRKRSIVRIEEEREVVEEEEEWAEEEEKFEEPERITGLV